MANTSITFTWYDSEKDTTDSYIHEMTSADMDRIIEAGRRIFGTANAESMTIELATRNGARKKMCKESLRIWKDRARQEEVILAQQEAANNVPPIESTEI